MPARPPLVMIPALLWDERLYRGQLDALGDLVEPTTMIVAEESWDAAAEAVIRRAPPGRFVLFGTSYGGSLAIEVALRVPERIAGLCVSGCSANISASKGRQNPMVERGLSGEEGFRSVVGELAEESVHPGGRNAGATKEAFRASARAAGPGTLRKQLSALTDRLDRRPDLASLGCPMLLLWGREDRIAGLDVAEDILRHAAPDRAELSVIDECGHLPTLERPEEATARLRGWLERVCATP